MMDLDKANLGATIVNIFITLGILLAAVIGLHRTADQIEAATLYQIASDGRDLMRQDRGDEDEATHVDVLSYFHSVFLLHQNDVIRDDAWTPISKAYCFFLKDDEDAKTYLSGHEERYDERFIELSNNYKDSKECVLG